MGCNLGESFFLTLTVTFTWKKLHVLVREGKDVDKVFWKRETYWQVQQYTLTHRLNNMNEWYVLNRQGYSK